MEERTPKVAKTATGVHGLRWDCGEGATGKRKVGFTHGVRSVEFIYRMCGYPQCWVRGRVSALSQSSLICILASILDFLGTCNEFSSKQVPHSQYT